MGLSRSRDCGDHYPLVVRGFGTQNGHRTASTIAVGLLPAYRSVLGLDEENPSEVGVERKRELTKRKPAATWIMPSWIELYISL